MYLILNQDPLPWCRMQVTEMMSFEKESVFLVRPREQGGGQFGLWQSDLRFGER